MNFKQKRQHIHAARMYQKKTRKMWRKFAHTFTEGLNRPRVLASYIVRTKPLVLLGGKSFVAKLNLQRKHD